MAHMQPQMTMKMKGWQVDTRDAGTCYVPEDVVRVESFFAVGQPILCALDCAEIVVAIQNRLCDYVEGRDFMEIEVVEGYFYRLSAPGYLDYTEWHFRKTLREAKAGLRCLSEDE